MRKALALTIVLASAMAMAQTTSVTLQVTDTPDSQSWNNGTYSVNLVIPSSFSGTQPTPQLVSGALNATGGASFVLASNAPIAGSYWRFSVCPQATADCYRQSVTVSGASQTVILNPPSIRINASNSPPSLAAYTTTEVTNPALGAQFFNLTSLTEQQWNGTTWASIGGGGGGGTAQPAFLVTAAPYNAKCDGSTDDTTALQSAITAACTAKGVVIVPGGPNGCHITSALTVPAGCSGLGIQGQLGLQGGIVQDTSNADILDVNGTVGSPVFMNIDHMVFGRKVAFTGTPVGLSFTHCANCNLNYVQANDSSTNFFTTGGSNNTWTYLQSASNFGTAAVGYSISGVTNSLFIENALAVGNHTTGLAFSGIATDTFVYHYSTTSAVSTAVSIPVGAANVHFIQPVLDGCGVSCFTIANSTTGGNGQDNNIEIIDCWCNAGANANQALNLSTANGVLVQGGTFIVAKTASAAIFGSTVGRSVFNGAKMIVNAGTNTSGCMVMTATNTVVSNNTCFGPTATPFSTAFTFNTFTFGSVSGNSVNGKGTTGFLFDAASVNNSVCSNNVDTTNITTKITNTGGASNVCGLTN